MRDSLTDPFWETPSLDDLEKEQRVRPVLRAQDVVGGGEDLWKSEEEFELFLAAIDRDHPEGTAA